MKRLLPCALIAIASLMLATELSAQVPGGFNFQAIARDGSGQILADYQLGVEVQILQDSEEGEPVYTETHTANTSESGAFRLVIGEGDSSDKFDDIEWKLGNMYVKLAIDADGGSNYEDLGVTRLLSVPYALFAQEVLHGEEGDRASQTEFQLNTTENDTSFIISATGANSLSALRTKANTDNQNIGVRSEAISKSSAGSIQVGSWASAVGEGNVSHYGLLGQSNSLGRYNYGVFGSARGEGSGELVAIGDETENFFGSFNIGAGFYSSGNINGNLGVEGVVSGDQGSRINIGVEGRVTATAGVPNIGINGRALNSPDSNTGLSGEATGPAGSNNIGVYGTANGEGNNHAGWFDGSVHVNGDLTVTGTVNETSDRNLKEHIRPLGNTLESVMQLAPAIYQYRGEEKYKGLHLSSGQHYGLLAQDVETVFPDLVRNNIHTYTEEVEQSSGPDTPGVVSVEKVMEYKTLNYTELIPVMIKAIQEQQEQIKELEMKIRQMEKVGYRN